MPSNISIIQNHISSLRDNLLDLSLRNNLINFKPRKNTIPIINEDIGHIFNLLVVNSEVLTFDFIDSDEPISDDTPWFRPDNNCVPENFTDLFLQTSLSEESLNSNLNRLIRSAKLFIEEQGFNNIFLALGFLMWKESDSELEFHKAPLILVPVNIIKDNINGVMQVEYNLEDIQANISLFYKLKEQDIILPLFDKDMESIDDIYEYLDLVKENIKIKDSWFVSNNIYLSDFNFKKFVMYKDLDLNIWPKSVENNNIINLFNSVEGDNEGFDEDYSNLNSTDFYNVLDADSSQLNALIYAKKYGNLVIEGPPGTGKSQTIVNLISELLANDKTVLFVSEKKAALEVVKNRLDSIGLGDACLELHSDKIKKKEVLEEIHRVLKLDDSVQVDNSVFEDLDSLRLRLNNYMDILSSEYEDTGFTVYDLIGMHELNLQILEESGQKIYMYNIPNVGSYDLNSRGECINNLKEIEHLYSLISPIHSNFWNDTNVDDLKSEDLNNINLYLNNLKDYLNDFINISKSFSEEIDCKEFNCLSDVFNIEFNSNLSILDDFNFEIIDKIKTFQNETENLDLTFLSQDLDDFLNDINNLKEKMDNLNISQDIFKLNLDELIQSFRKHYNYINKSQYKTALNGNLEYNLDIFIENKDSLFGKLNPKVKESKQYLRTFHPQGSDEELINDYKNLINENIELNLIKNQILEYSSVNMDNNEILKELESLQNMELEYNNIKNKAEEYTNKEFKNIREIQYQVIELIKIKKTFQEIKEYPKREIFKKEWKDINSNTQTLENIVKINIEFTKLYNDGIITDNTIKYINNNPSENINQTIKQLNQLKENINIEFNKLNQILQFEGEIQINTINTIETKTLEKHITDLIENTYKLNDFRNYRTHIKNPNPLISPLIQLINQDQIKTECIIPLFNYNYAINCLNDVLEKNNEILFNFNSNIEDELIEKFKTLDKKALKENQNRVKEIIINKRPNLNQTINRQSSLGILLNEINKKRNVKPLRKTLKEAQDTIINIKPCFLMSPISIAQYLDPMAYEGYFDYVIFDEASQVKVEDGIGAIMRGKNSIVIGDKKQLPPTNFFDVELENEDEEINLSNDESILNTCSLAFPSKMLKWHYRSRHESLIAVSNMEFYNNELYIYPSPKTNDDTLGLKLEYHEDTTYEKGTSRKNPKEAEYIIDYAMEQFEKHGYEKTLGIGTFSKAQQEAIYDTLEIKLKEKPHLEEYFNSTRTEGFFVKNLENIQGDERDIILISIGYGYDNNHKLTLNFGPLNKDGGERRLNVLITRAKEKCVVFTNFKSNNITETKTPGVKVLKNFLYYAENQKFPPTYQTGEDFDSEFEKAVYKFLKDQGHNVEKQVGCAGYKIDLAIKDPQNPDNYILAIECDGAPYHSTPSARDRDRLRQQVLEGLGWKFHRIWSTDWYNNRKNAQKTLIEKIDKIKQENTNIKEAKKLVDTPLNLNTTPKKELLEIFKQIIQDEISLPEFYEQISKKFEKTLTDQDKTYITSLIYTIGLKDIEINYETLKIKR